MRSFLLTLAALLLAATLASLGMAYSGLYNVAADDPHWSFTSRLLETVRARSVSRRAEGVRPPRLDDPQLVLKGAGQYAAMCVGCHLAPGISQSELSKGLYPQPPRLDKQRLDPREAFVVIKHGLKMTGMPAWGADHDDETVWSLVAFIGQLPGMTPEQYREIVRKAPPDEEMSHSHAAEHARGVVQGPNASGSASASSATHVHRHLPAAPAKPAMRDPATPHHPASARP